MTSRVRNKVVSDIVRRLKDNKAERVVALDIRKKSSLSDYMVVAGGTSTRHVMSLAHHLAEDLKKENINPLNDCHQGGGHWAVLDLGNIIVHVLTEDVRAEYALEKLWG